MRQGKGFKKLVKITPPQLSAICEAANTLSAMIGVGEEAFDRENTKIVKAIDRFLKANGYRRKFK